MSTALQHRRGTTTQHASFTGAAGEVSVDTTKNTAVVHDGATAGGFALAKESQLGAFRNRIINGAMVIDQRNAGASVSITTATYTLDRFSCGIGYSTGHTAQQSTNAPSNYKNSLLITVGTGASPTAGQIGRIVQAIEGFNVSDFGWGTATASAITLSFWVKSSLTGTFAGGIYNNAANRTYVFTYVINAANTWEQKTVTIAGDTSGTWTTDNTAGMWVNWDLGTGSTFQGTANTWAAGAAWATSTSVKLAATSGATLQITGVQLEKGSTATSFDYRPYGTELSLCQRYYAKLTSDGALFGAFANGICNAANNGQGFLAKLPVTMRTQPTATFASLRVYDGAAAAAVSSISSVSACSTANTLGFDVACSASFLTTGRPGTLQGDNTTAAFLAASAEL